LHPPFFFLLFFFFFFLSSFSAYRCAELALTLEGPLPRVDKFSKAKRAREKYGANKNQPNRKQRKEQSVDASSSLLVHRLPPGSTQQTVEAFFVEAAEIKPAKVTSHALSVSLFWTSHHPFLRQQL
jgi:hypothetical protein